MKNFDLIKSYRGLPRSIYIIFFASIINNMGNFVMPFLTMYLTYNVGISVGIVGIVVAANSALGMAGSLIGGKLIDTKGRKYTFIIFRTLSALSVLACTFIKSPAIVVVLLMGATFFGGFSQPVYSTMITDLTKGEERKVAFSLEYMAINIGFSVGPLIAAFLYKNYIIGLFLGDAITTLISIILVGVFVPETIGLRKEKDSKTILSNSNFLEKDETGGLFTALLRRKTLMVFSFIIVIYFIVFSQFNFGLSLQIGEVFKDNMPVVFGILMTINAMMCSLLTPMIIVATKNTSSSLSIALGGILYALGFGMMFFINSFYMFVLSTVIWTAGEILVANNTSVYIASHTPATHRGRFNSIFPMIRRLGFILGPLLAGACIKYYNIRILWIFVGSLALIGAAMMYRLYNLDRIIATEESSLEKN
ncbi:MAG: MFS transporter [Clostridium sp.]|uniref:MDR family MFS transporter n=1 Tax=Clostridium sp. TaxID=1506 RepID=UPI00304E6F1B